MTKVLYILFALLLCLAFSPGYNLVDYPDYFPSPLYDFTQNKHASDKIEIGRALFYDTQLSADNSISCASCHSPYNAFAHSDHKLSHGIKDQIGTRNAPALFNLAWNKSFMWDGAIKHLDIQALAPIEHAQEMGSSLEFILEVLNNSPIYSDLFYKAYGDSLITGERVLKSLSQFQLTLVSDNAKYDQVRKGQNTFSIQEKSGYDLFKNNCNSCHTEPLFTSGDLARNGLPTDPALEDLGHYNVSGRDEDTLLFKIPSLRNLKYSAPYMHDGRFKSLSEVIDHYSTEKTDVLIENIELTEYQRRDLIAFLLTLSDTCFVLNPNHRFPRDLLLPQQLK